MTNFRCWLIGHNMVFFDLDTSEVDWSSDTLTLDGMRGVEGYFEIHDCVRCGHRERRYTRINW